MLRAKQSLLLLEASVEALFNDEGLTAETAQESVQHVPSDCWATIEETWGQFHRFKAALSLQFTVNRDVVLDHVGAASAPVAALLLSRSSGARLLVRDMQKQATCLTVQDAGQDENQGVGRFDSVSNREVIRIVEEHPDMDLGAYLISRCSAAESITYKTLPPVNFEDIGRTGNTLAAPLQVAALSARCQRLEEALYDLTEQLQSSFLTHPRDVEDLEAVRVSQSEKDQDVCPVRIPTTLNPWRSTHKVSLPRRIILVRHGESLGNADESIYGIVPDWKVPLTSVGREQARNAGQEIAALIGSDPINIYTSPYLRTKQTLAMILESLPVENVLGIREEPRLTEQQFGNFQDTTVMSNAKSDRHRYGRFYFRFPNGESGLDVYERVTSFIATLFRDFSSACYTNRNASVLIVTHGLTLRLLLMRWFQYTITDFEETVNPANGEVYVMERKVNEYTQKEWMELSPESCEKVKFNPRSPQHGMLSKFAADLKAEEEDFKATFQEVMEKPGLFIPVDPDLVDISRS